MAQYQSQYDSARQTDEYGNSVGQKDEYGNPVGHHTGSEYGTVGYETATTGGGKYGGNTVDSVGQKDEYGNPVGHHTGSEYGTVGYETATTGGGKYGENTVDPDPQTDEYGKPVGRRDECGNPIGHHTRNTGDEYGTVGYETTATGAGNYGGAPESGIDIGGEYNKEQHGNLRRSGSSSSEDDGQGGRRKKGIKEKIKQKLPGTGQDDDPSYVTSSTQGGYYSEEQPHEKKGIMDRIKEKLPGRHDDQ